jgi:hypothetical protein
VVSVFRPPTLSAIALINTRPTLGTLAVYCPSPTGQHVGTLVGQKLIYLLFFLSINTLEETSP